MTYTFERASINSDNGQLIIQPNGSSFINVTCELVKGILTVNADMVMWGYNSTHEYKPDEVKPEYIIIYKNWYWFGKSKQRVKDGWVKLNKPPQHKIFISSTFTIIQ